jgi:hypothetical protein
VVCGGGGEIVYWKKKEKKFHAFHNQIHSNGISRFVHKSM